MRFFYNDVREDWSLLFASSVMLSDVDLVAAAGTGIHFLQRSFVSTMSLGSSPCHEMMELP